MGSALQFKPVLSIGNGIVNALERPRTQAKAVRRILEIIATRAERLRQEVTSLFNCRELYVTDLRPVLGTHAGPGVLGMAWWSEEDEEDS